MKKALFVTNEWLNLSTFFPVKESVVRSVSLPRCAVEHLMKVSDVVYDADMPEADFVRYQLGVTGERPLRFPNPVPLYAFIQKAAPGDVALCVTPIKGKYKAFILRREHRQRAQAGKS